MNLGAMTGCWLAVMILPVLTLPAVGGTRPAPESLAVLLLRHAEATGNPARARAIAEFLAPGYPEDGRTLLGKVSKALAGEHWQGVLPRVQERVTALGGEPFTLPPQPADETRFANIFLGWLDLSSVEAAQAQLAKAQAVFAQDARLSRLATRLAALAESEKKRLNLEQQGKFLVSSYTNKIEELQETKLPKNFYEERAFRKLPAAEREAIFKEEATFKQNLQQGYDILAQAKGITPAADQLAAVRAEVAAMLPPPVPDQVSAGNPESAEPAKP